MTLTTSFLLLVGVRDEPHFFTSRCLAGGSVHSFQLDLGRLFCAVVRRRVGCNGHVGMHLRGMTRLFSDCDSRCSYVFAVHLFDAVARFSDAFGRVVFRHSM